MVQTDRERHRFHQVLALFPLPAGVYRARRAQPLPDALLNLGRSRVRESRTVGSVVAKAEWLSYPTIHRRLAQCEQVEGDCL